MADIPESTKSALAPQISDEWIAERWPDQDPAEVRRRFDALMDKLGETPWRGIPGYPETMQPVLAWAAMLPVERIETLTAALADVPEHLRDYLYVAEKPAFGEQRVKYENVVGDNGHGMGRQAIAITPYVKGYNLAPWIAAASPGNVGALLAELHRHRAAPPAMDREAVEFNGSIRQAQRALRFLAENDRPIGGEEFANAASLEQIADDLEVTRKRLSTLSADAIRQGEGDGWLPITDDAKSGALVELVVDYKEGEHPLTDAILACTIGFNTLADAGVDEWKFAGWCWTHDHFVQGKGTPVAWRPSRLNAADDGLPPLPATPASHASDGEGA